MGRRMRSVMASGLAVVLASGCASTTKVPVHGRQVTVLQEGDAPKLEGELVTVDSQSLWVEEEDEIVGVPLPSVREVRVKRHGMDGGAAGMWSLLGGLTTGGLMAGACASADGGSCGAVGLVVAGLWVVVGLLSAGSMERSSRLDLWKPTPEELREFARLPQGWPESFRAPTLDSGAKGDTDTEGKTVAVE